MRTPMRSQRTAVSGQRERRTFRAFTLTEMMVAVVVLIVVIIATSKIFGTASQITAVGTASISVMQEAAAIERQFRDDIAKLTNEGFFAIRCVGVRNDKGVTGGPLMNPNLPPDAIIRADQLVFFAHGVESPHTYRMGEASGRRGAGVACRFYYGHAFQLPEAQGVTLPATNVAVAHDPISAPTPASNGPNAIQPWYAGVVQMIDVKFEPATLGSPVFGAVAGTPPAVNVSQIEPRKWLLVRQPVLLVDDDTDGPLSDNKTVYLDHLTTARSIFWQLTNTPPWGFSREVRNGRVDGAASDLNEIRRFIQTNSPLGGSVTGWPAQRNRISSAVYYPRAERKAPSMHRVDQALTNHVISSACSSFIVDWTYEHKLGEFNATHDGLEIISEFEHPWFGLTDDSRRVFPLMSSPVMPVAQMSPLDPTVIESTFSPAPGVQIYEACFGYNQTHKVDPSTNAPWSAGSPAAYTPFPKALRITMTLHDPEGKLEGGREFQFVVDLPRRPN